MKLYLMLGTVEYDGDIYYKWYLYNLGHTLVFQSKVEVAQDGLTNLAIAFASIMSRVKCLAYEPELLFQTNNHFLCQYYWYDTVDETLTSFDQFNAINDLKESLLGIKRRIHDSDAAWVFSNEFAIGKLTKLVDEVQQYVDGFKKIDEKAKENGD